MRLCFCRDSGRSTTLSAMSRLEFRPLECTNTVGGLEMALQLFIANNRENGRSSAPDVAIVVTDGHSNVGGRPRDAAEKLWAEGIRVISVGIGQDVNTDELRDIASYPKTNNVDVFQVNDVNQLVYIVGQLALEVCAVPK